MITRLFLSYVLRNLDSFRSNILLASDGLYFIFNTLPFVCNHVSITDAYKNGHVTHQILSTSINVNHCLFLAPISEVQLLLDSRMVFCLPRTKTGSAWLILVQPSRFLAMVHILACTFGISWNSKKEL